ncbi:MAG TPA: hypothetical protein PLI18_19910, partial [Pirellulaceae bacterium]|nr:hypothetical protein [Pirellulaceae bacterium]
PARVEAAPLIERRLTDQRVTDPRPTDQRCRPPLVQSLSNTLRHVAGLLGIAESDRGNARRGPTPPAAPLAPPPRLVAEARHQELRGRMPIVDDAELARLIETDRLTFYSEREIPRAFPKWNGLAAGVHDAYYNISAESGEPFGNGNREFPWDGAGGTHRAAGFDTLHFIALPTDAAGKLLPIVYRSSPATASGAGEVSWRFPHGTIVGECLLIEFDDGTALPCELRIRRRVQEDWESDVFRPFPTADDLATRIEAVRPEWASDPSLVSLMTHLRDANTLRRGTLRDDHPVRSFDQSAGIDELPEIEPELVRTLLETTPFRSCLDRPWKENAEGLVCHAPTTSHRQQLVPVRYDGGFLKVDSASCLRCHATVGVNVARFDAGREWYGNIRGSDGIFSFHPFDRVGISGNGNSVPVVIRQELITLGLLAKYDPQLHAEEHYSEFRPGAEARRR